MDEALQGGFRVGAELGWFVHSMGIRAADALINGPTRTNVGPCPRYCYSPSMGTDKGLFDTPNVEAEARSDARAEADVKAAG